MTGRLRGTLLGVLGFILSPFSWWNDMFVNIPLAYLFALPFSLISERLLLPALIVGYWLTNVLGLVLLHNSARKLAHDGDAPPTKWRTAVIASLVYTALLTALAASGWLRTPWEYFAAHRWPC